jgi:hypothetical protein
LPVAVLPRGHGGDGVLERKGEASEALGEGE